MVSGFDALAYQEHLDYSIVQSTEPEYNKALVRVNIFRDHRQTIQVSLSLSPSLFLPSLSPYSPFLSSLSFILSFSLPLSHSQQKYF
jgi:hypothetical protein